MGLMWRIDPNGFKATFAILKFVKETKYERPQYCTIYQKKRKKKTLQNHPKMSKNIWWKRITHFNAVLSIGERGTKMRPKFLTV